MNYRAMVVHPSIGPPIAVQRASFTIEDATPCTGFWDKYLGLYVVFSSPNELNKTYFFSQEELQARRADVLEIALEVRDWLVPGIYGLQIQIRDVDTQQIRRKTDTKSLVLSD